MSVPSSATVHPSTVVNPKDHGAIVTVTAALCFTISSTFLVARGIVRWPWRTLVGRDDIAAGASLLVGVVNVILVCVAAKNGLGKAADMMSLQTRRTVANLGYTSDLFFILSMCFGRLSVSLLLLRLASSDRHKRFAAYLCFACGLYGLAGFLTIAIRNPMISPGEHLLSRWIGAGVLGSLTDLGMVVFPVFLVRGLQMQRATKMTVVTGFGMRLPVIAFCIVRLHSLAYTVRSADPNFHYAMTGVWTQLELHYNLIAATIPCLRIFLRAFHTGKLGGSIETMDPMDSRGATKGSGAYGRTTRRSTIHATNGNLSSRLTRLREDDEHYVEDPEKPGYLRHHDSGQSSESSKSAIEKEKGETPGEASERAIMVQHTVDVQYQ